MSMQFAGASSTGDRRRRRLVVNRDGAGVDALQIDGDGAEIESQLVASAAAAPWVPSTELRIWIYASLIGLLLAGVTFALIRPFSLPSGLSRLADHLLAGPRPRIAIITQTMFLAISTQMGLLIGWYRSRCKLDFSGRYRVWPWAVALFGLATFCVATNFHQVIGEVVSQRMQLSWKGEAVSWLLPFCLMALPIALLLDRDVRSSRSSLYTLRFSGLIWWSAAWLELYWLELQSRPWAGIVRQLLPVFASATLFIGLWLHARIVAYVCPDPPKLEERSAWSLFLGGSSWLVGRFVSWKRVDASTATEDEGTTKPKRRRKKADVEEVEVKRKRRTPAKRTPARTRTRAKLPEPDESEETADETSYEDSDTLNEESYEAASDETNSSLDDEGSEWNEEVEESPPDRTANVTSNGNGRFTQVHQAHAAHAPAPHTQHQEPSWQADEEPAPSASNQFEESSDESDEDKQFQLDSGMTADQMKGLSKRQRRELKKQQRDQERTRGR